MLSLPRSFVTLTLGSFLLHAPQTNAVSMHFLASCRNGSCCNSDGDEENVDQDTDADETTDNLPTNVQADLKQKLAKMEPGKKYKVTVHDRASGLQILESVVHLVHEYGAGGLAAGMIYFYEYIISRGQPMGPTMRGQRAPNQAVPVSGKGRQQSHDGLVEKLHKAVQPHLSENGAYEVRLEAVV